MTGFNNEQEREIEKQKKNKKNLWRKSLYFIDIQVNMEQLDKT
jgi:hypothetical protein